MQADGKILVGGEFSTLGGKSRSRLGRLNADGSVDLTFNPGADYYVNTLAVQADGKILVGGFFTTLGGESRSNLGRLNADGSVDLTFNPGANGTVYTLASQADGKILVGGYFTTLGGESRSRLGRLNADGSVDLTFNPGADGSVYTLAVQADGKILVGGGFSTLGGESRNYLGRLNADGTVDLTFNPGATYFVGTYYVYTLAVQADGKILVGGNFDTLGGKSRSRLGRLNADGSVDLTFNPGANGSVHTLAVQADGKILVGWDFTTLGGERRSRLGRLNADGSVDLTFNPGADYYVDTLAVQADGKILVGGNFTTLGGESRKYLGRLNNTGAATQSLGYDGAALTWLRGGTSPEVSAVVFEHSADGLHWTHLGVGERVVGGWALSGANVPAGGTLRGRGQVSDGHSSTWWTEAYWGAPVWITTPASRVNDAQTTAMFSALARGSEPLSYQWFKNGVPLADGGKVAGSTGPTLTLSGVLKEDAGLYTVTVSNSEGSLTSAAAELTVNDPAITVQPASQNRESGQGVAFSVTAVGTVPLAYQWSKDGVALADGQNVSGATGSTLTLSDLQGSDAGLYTVTVSNASGSMTSASAALTVNLVTSETVFNPGADYYVNTLAVQADGKILVGGGFTTLGGESRSNLGRLNADGSVDLTFDPGADWSVLTLALQADGKILVGGNFDTLGGQSRKYLGRLYNTGAATQSLGYDGAALTWLRGGTGPEFGSTSFAYSTDDILWTDLGMGERIPGGWRLAGVSLPASCAIRAQGRVSNGSSTWLVETAARIEDVWREGPDLVVSSLEAPLQALAGTTQPLVWTIANRGSHPVAGDWVDRVYLSLDQGVSHQLLVGEFPASGPLGVNESRERHHTVLLPADLLPGLEYWWIVITDDDDDVAEEHEGNNVRIGETPLRVLQAAAPNLQVTAVAVPAAAASGQPMIVTWTVTNTGTSSTGAEVWHDAVHLSTDEELDEGDHLLGQVVRPDALGTDQAYDSTLAATLPQGISGSWYLLVTTDVDNTIHEDLFEHDNTVVARLTVLMPPTIATHPQGVSAIEGDEVTFTVVATGTEPMEYSWSLNGSPIPNSNNPVLRFGAITAEDAGVYQVVISNTVGTVTSNSATLEVVRLTLRILTVDGVPVIEWSGTARLEWTDRLMGEWHELQDASSPFTIVPEGSGRFYRLVR